MNYYVNRRFAFIIDHFCTLCRMSTNQEYSVKSKKFHDYGMGVV